MSWSWLRMGTHVLVLARGGEGGGTPVLVLAREGYNCAGRGVGTPILGPDWGTPPSIWREPGTKD